MSAMAGQASAAAAPGAGILAHVERLRADAVAAAAAAARDLAGLPPSRRASAENLVHYLALRRRDLRPVQEALSALGLSSLGRCEGNVLAALDRLRDVLLRLGSGAAAAPDAPDALRPDAGRRLLAAARHRLFGAPRAGRRTAIMVTLPESAADDRRLVRALLAAGMDVARINTAHGDLPTWRRMAQRVRAVAAALGRPCRIAVDLPGPKLRTGALTPLPGVLRCKPERDRLGRTIAPGRVRLVAEGGEPPADALPLPAALVAALRGGDRLRLTDARGKHRELAVERAGGELWALAGASVYLVAGLELRQRRGTRTLSRGRVGRLPVRVEPLRLHRGDHLLLTDGTRPGGPERRDRRGRLLAPAAIPCALPQALSALRRGQRVCFDDGRVIARVRRRCRGGVELRIESARVDGARLKPDQGVNFPDSTLALPALAAADHQALRFAVAYADLIEQSFVRSPGDIATLAAALRAAGGQRLGVIAKIETPQAFADLPRILLALQRLPAAGVMIARGDLAVEIGFERLAEVQEEILWLCEAAHLPAVWGTQVLESMAKTGLPTRAEVTDAAMSVRAECVMLNKGAHLPATIAFLGDVLARMQAHVDKKRSRLRRLAVAGRG